MPFATAGFCPERNECQGSLRRSIEKGTHSALSPAHGGCCCSRSLSRTSSKRATLQHARSGLLADAAGPRCDDRPQGVPLTRTVPRDLGGLRTLAQGGRDDGNGGSKIILLTDARIAPWTLKATSGSSEADDFGRLGQAMGLKTKKGSTCDSRWKSGRRGRLSFSLPVRFKCDSQLRPFRRPVRAAHRCR